MKKYIEEIQKIIQEWEGHPYDACAEIIKFIADGNTESWLLIKEVLSTPIDIGNDEAKLEGIDQDDFNRYIYRYQDYLISLVETLSMKDAEQDDFYKELYDCVFRSSIIPEDQCHQAIYLFVLSKRVKLLPYYQTTNILRMKEEKYKETIDSIRAQLLMAFHMCARKFDTKTETTSQYWEIANQLSNRDEQIVFWSFVMQMEKDKKSENK